MARKEQIKEAAAKRKEKQADVVAKDKIRAKIAADKEERRLKSEREKAEREGRVVQLPPTSTPQISSPIASKSASEYTETRLRLQTSNGNVQKAFPVTTTLFEVAEAITAENGSSVQSFTQNFPKKIFDHIDFGATLKELGLVPSASLIVR